MLETLHGWLEIEGAQYPERWRDRLGPLDMANILAVVSIAGCLAEVDARLAALSTNKT